MRILAMLASLALFPQSQARELIEKLGSEKIEERDQATAKLKELGEKARAELEAASGHKDPEVVDRSRRLLRLLDIRKSVSPAVRKVLPGVEERLAAQGAHAWTELLLELLDQDKYPGLEKADLEFLAAPAVAGSRSPEEKSELCRLVSQQGFRSAIPELIKCLNVSQDELRRNAVYGLGTLGAKEAIPEIVKSFALGEDSYRYFATKTLKTLGAKEAAVEVLKLLGNSNAQARGNALWSLGELGARDAIPEI